MSSQFKALLPNPSQSSSGPLEESSASKNDEHGQLAKRLQVSVACLMCRKHKAKCDGKQPCKRCVSRRFTCEYESREDTRSGALKRRMEGIQSAQNDLQELFSYIHSRPEDEAYEIFKLIRANPDPFEVLRSIKHGDLLLEQAPSPAVDTPSPDAPASPKLLRLDSDALHASPFKVHARPWTGLAGDGLVSELISSFFAWDQPFYFGFVDRECFLIDMDASDLMRAQFCSAMLVNAICALRCHTSHRAKFSGFAQDKNLGEQFFNEAKKLFESEGGAPSLPNSQALLIMYVCCAGLGKDRAGTTYRYAAHDMLKQLRLENRFEELEQFDTDESAVRERRAISRALWGAYCFESISSFAYLQPSLVKPPSIPRDFDGESDDTLVMDVHGQIFTSSSPSPPLINGVLNAMCDLGEILWRVMKYIQERIQDLGSPTDLEQRLLLYRDVLNWRENLPNSLKIEHCSVPQTFHLSAYEDMVVLAIFCPLPPATRLLYEPGTALEQCIARCRRSLSGLEAYALTWNMKEYSIFTVFPLYSSSVALVAHLDDTRTHDLFARACFMLLQRAHDFPFTMYLLQGLRAMATEYGKSIPPGAAQYLENLRFRKEGLQDVPIGFVVPRHSKMPRNLSGDGSSKVGSELGVLISKYSSMTMD